MNKLSLLVLLCATSLWSVEIPQEQTKLRSFGNSIELNSQIIQLSNAKQSITSLVSGHLEKYFVEAGQTVKSGQKIALIESILISKMTSDFISLNKQLIALNENYNASEKLYKKGLVSIKELNNLKINKTVMEAKLIGVTSQLKTIGVKTETLKEATGDFILYAHSDGRVSNLLQSLHSVVKEDEAVISIVKEQSFYVKSYVPLKYSNTIKMGQKLVVDYNDRKIVTHITQILPELDFKTQRIVILSKIEEKANDLFINTFVPSTIYFEGTKKYVSVNKTALSFYNNEWVVFVPSENAEEEKEENNKKIDSGEEEEEVTVPYEARVVKIILQNEKYVAVKGIELNEEYVSGKSYYIKSMLLKSSLGDGD